MCFVEKWLLVLLLALVSVYISRSKTACFKTGLFKLLCGAGKCVKNWHAWEWHEVHTIRTENKEWLISRSVWGVRLRPLACWNCGFESCWNMGVRLLWVWCFVIRPEESYRVWCVWVQSWSIDEEVLARKMVSHHWKENNKIIICLIVPAHLFIHYV
jgi:hypothetical protein